MLQIICMLFTFVVLSIDARAGNLYFICPVSGSYNYWGISGDQRLLKGNFTQEVIVTIGIYDKMPIMMYVEPKNNGLKEFRQNGFGATTTDELIVQDTDISIEKRFIKDISNWKQSASLNRITLFLKVHASREFIKPPSEGLSIDYSGTCSPTDRKI